MVQLQHVAFDIETTGLGATDAVTVIGFELSMGCRVFIQTDGRTIGDVEQAIREQVDEPIQLSTHPSERAVLEAVKKFVAVRLQSDDVLLVAYNGEIWRGGFDLPFLRTRYATHDIGWPFRGLPYADLLPIIRELFNTTIDGDACADLDTAYRVLCDGDYGEVDPFTDSAAAADAFVAGEFAPLVTHNVVDILRTGQLSRLAQRYCSKSDFSLKSLTPVNSEFGQSQP